MVSINGTNYENASFPKYDASPPNSGNRSEVVSNGGIHVITF